MSKRLQKRIERKRTIRREFNIRRNNVSDKIKKERNIQVVPKWQQEFYNKIIKYIYLCFRFDLSVDDIKALETEIKDI